MTSLGLEAILNLMVASLLEALRHGAPRPSPADSAPASSSDSKKRPASSSSSKERDLEQHYGFQSPFLASEQFWGGLLQDKQRDLVGVLSVDHVDLQEANEREAAAGGVGAVVTKKTAKASVKREAEQPIADQLLQACAQYVATTDSSIFSPVDLAEIVLQTVQDNPRNADTVQAQLFGLVGVEGMDLIAFAVQKQSELETRVTKQSLQDAQKQQEMAERFASRASARPGGAFRIQTDSEQQFERQQRKTQRKNRGQQEEEEEQNWLEAAGYDPEVLRLQREFAQEEMRNQSTSLLQQQFGALHGGYDSNAAAGQLASAGLLTLPSSTKRTYFKGYEHVFIPAHAKKALEKNEALVPISELDAFAHSAFRGIENLNRLQSKLFHSAYNSNQNLLVCAPTGAGKTNVAMLAIMQEIKSQMQRKHSLAQMKIIYVAPMKALAQEVVTKFGERLSSLKIKVAELTGDMQLTRKEIETTHVIVTTPEKWDVITRKSSTQQALLSQVRLLIIDEVHLLADERGPVIETIVARTLRRVESTQSMIRIVGLSATLPNYADVASFLRVYVPPGDARMQNAATNGGKGGLFYFDSTYRPVPLDQTFIGISTNANLKEALGLSAQALTTAPTDGAGTEQEEQNTRGKPPSAMSKIRQIQLMMNKLALAHCVKQARNSEQVMVFVHSRKETAATMRALIELAQADEDDATILDAFLPPEDLSMPLSLIERVQKSRNKELKELLAYGLGIHHAGMLRSDRNLSEQLFEQGYVRVLCCTATLAWGVNLPAHSVLIKGTQVYNADKGGMTQLSMLDVMQIFGRAGRPQYDTSGDAVLMTTQDQLPHYLRSLTTGVPMESALIKALPDHLNAEIVSGTVTNLEEACEWLSYTYLYVRMRKNPLAYGMKLEDVQMDPMLIERRKQLLMDAATKLAGCRMIKIMREKTRLDQPADEGKVAFAVTAMGRVASHFYIQHTSIQSFNELLDGKRSSTQSENDLDWDKVLLVLCSSNEFDQIKSREDEMTELEKLKRQCCRVEVLGGSLESSMGKTNVLLQALISKARVSSFTLISDTNYVAQNASRVCRALFEICLKKNGAQKAEKFLQLAKCIDQRVWWDQSPLLQLPNVPAEVVANVEAQRLDIYDVLLEPAKYTLSAKVEKWITSLPLIELDHVRVQPFGGNMLKVSWCLSPVFREWKEHMFAGKSLGSWLWVEDAATGFIYHSEYTVLHQSQYLSWKNDSNATALDMECFVPVFLSATQPDASYIIRLLSDRFVGMETYYEVTYTPEAVDPATAHKEKQQMYTDLLRLHPQPLASLANPIYEQIYGSRFQFFNPIQTQAFHQLYHQDGNVLLCAPTGSGKTICAELAMLRVWNQQQLQQQSLEQEDAANNRSRGGSRTSLIVYIAPLKALAREKVSEWKQRFEAHPQLRKKVVEVTGDTLVNVDFLLKSADIVVTTPEKWDLLTRNVAVGSKLMAQTALVVIDEVHLVGEVPRGAVLEVLMARLRRFGRDNAKKRIRLVALSTALANAQDVGQWLGITKSNDGQVYNFRASVRPVPMDVHIQGFPERHYVARMAAMNKPTYMAITTHSPDKPALIFVSSKAQTKLTALDLISYCVSQPQETELPGSSSAKRFLHMDESYMDAICDQVHDETLKHTLTFGIGLHHAGLSRSDRELVERLYRDRMIQVIISTSTLAWGVNLPAHLVVVKGTDYFQNGRYRSYPLSDLLQMIGRAGRPGLDTKGVACVLVEETQKNRIQRLLYEPLAVESCLMDHVENHVNAEIASGNLRTMVQVVDYLSWTLLFQRVASNPRFYGVGAGEGESRDAASFFQSLVTKTMTQLTQSQCVVAGPRDGSLQTTVYGQVAAQNYIDVRSIANLRTAIAAIASDYSGSAAASGKKQKPDPLQQLMSALCESSVELHEAVPLRAHELQSNLLMDLCTQVPYSPLTSLYAKQKKQHRTLLESHGSAVKCFVLLQMHLKRTRMPSSEFANDLRTLFDHVPRLLSAAIEISAVHKCTPLVMAGIHLSQAIVQALWPETVTSSSTESVFAQLPQVSPSLAQFLKSELKITAIPELQDALQVAATKSRIQSKLKAPNNNSSRSAKDRDRAMNELLRVVNGIPRVSVSARIESKTSDEGTTDVAVITLELTRVGKERGQQTALASSKRFPKPKPYAFYVVLTHGSAEAQELLHLKHVSWRPAPLTLRIPLASDKAAAKGSLKVHVLSDAIAGTDVNCSVE